MLICDLAAADQDLIDQVAAMLVDAFRDNHPEAWPALDDALEEVHESFSPDRISRVAVDVDGKAIGWVGGIKQYDGAVWELHPLVVRPDCQRQGIGAALVRDLEGQVRIRGGLSVYLGSDDENNQTSLGGVELFPGVLDKLRTITNLREHPFEFYQRQGYEIVGIQPYANGFGRPDILMAKRL